MESLGNKIVQIIKSIYTDEVINNHMNDLINENYEANTSGYFNIIATEYNTGEKKEFIVNTEKDTFNVIGISTHLLWDNIINIIVAVGDVKPNEETTYKLEKCFFVISYNSLYSEVSLPMDFEVNYSHMYH